MVCLNPWYLNLAGVHILRRLRNRGELVEGWYDPEILEKARSRAQQPAPPSSDNGFVMHGRHSKLIEEHGKDEDEEDAYGPRLPSNVFVAGQGLTWSKSGPTIPSIDDLQIKRGNLRYTKNCREIFEANSLQS